MGKKSHITVGTIKDRLEATYDIPFEVSTEHSSNGVLLSVAVVSEGNDSFSLNFLAVRRVRLKISLKPDDYSQPLFQSMAQSDEKSRALFKDYAASIAAESNSASFLINNKVDLFLAEPSEWPTRWTSADLQIEVFPIPECTTEQELLSFFLPWVERVSNLMLSLVDFAEDPVEGAKEGSKISAAQTRYERSPKNRAACLAHYGYRCRICGFDFAEKYGTLGAGYIQVHHIVPVSQIGEDYFIDPISDLIPVCPNCHAMLHRKDPPLLPDELQTIIDNAASSNQHTT